MGTCLALGLYETLLAVDTTVFVCICHLLEDQVPQNLARDSLWGPRKLRKSAVSSSKSSSEGRFGVLRSYLCAEWLFEDMSHIAQLYATRAHLEELVQVLDPGRSTPPKATSRYAMVCVLP